MGPELGAIFHATSVELSWLHWRWKQYRILFGEKPSRINLLNQSAPFFFRVIQDALLEDTFLGIARLVGPSASLNKPNLTIQRLPSLISNASLRDEVQTLVRKAKTSAAFADDWRNRHIAHRDLQLALDKSARRLAVATRGKIEDSLSAMREVLNHIEDSYCNAVTAYYSPSPGDAETLLYVLRDGLMRERDRRERWDRGERHEDDLMPPEDI